MEQSPFPQSPIEPAERNSAHPEPQERVIAVHRFADLYVRYRKLIFVAVAVFILLAFNGQWIIERDTSLYRGLGHSLATGNGYTFGEFASRQVYPGVPLMLAGLEIVFGETALPAIVLMNLMTAAILVLTYKLVGLRFPQWVAVAVTAGVGFNATLHHLTQEIMTDVPFLLGVMLALYGWERLKLATSHRQRINVGLLLLMPGLVIAILTRPTFWILAISWVLVCAWSIARGPRRRFHAVSLLTILVVAVTWFFVDPRTRGFNPLAGGYEHDFVASLYRAGTAMAENLWGMLYIQLPNLFFGGRFGKVITPLLSVILIGMTVQLFRRGLTLWGLMIVMTVLVTLAIGPVWRYYLMVLPLMMLAYVLLANYCATRAGTKWADHVMRGFVLLLLIPNIARGVNFVYEQHWDDPGQRKEWADSLSSAELVREYVPEGGKVIAPGAPIVSYFSGRQAYMSRELFPESKPPSHWPKYIARKGVEYAIFPPSRYTGPEGHVARLMEHGVIVPVERVARDQGNVLCRIEIVVPPEGKDWRKNPVTQHEWVTTTQRGPTSAQLRRQAQLRKQAAEARARRERAELKAKLEAKQRREAKLAREAKERRERMEARKRYEARLAREAKARRLRRLRQQRLATQPSSQPATRPAVTAPVSMRLEGDRVILSSPYWPMMDHLSPARTAN